MILFSYSYSVSAGIAISACKLMCFVDTIWLLDVHEFQVLELSQTFGKWLGRGYEGYELCMKLFEGISFAHVD